MSAPQRVGPYEVLGVLGAGGMGAVLRVRHPRLDAERALKLLLRPTPKQKARFERELLRLASINHPNVVGIHETGVAEDGRPYFVMDLLEGRTLDRVLDEDGAPALEQALEWALGICAGVSALHAQGVVHRDLKPQNVILTADGRPVVLDVGLAVDPHNDDRLTRTGALVGTLSYMAPEQLSKGEPTPRTDVYALGLILHELVTGETAAPIGGSAEVVAEILGMDRPLPGHTDPSLPAALDRVAARATARDPETRYADAEELGQALRDVLEAPGVSRRTVRLLNGLLVAAALVALGVVAASVWRTAPSASRPAPASTPTASARSALSKLRRVTAPEDRARAAAAWLEAHPDDPERAEVEALRRQALLVWGREELKGLRAEASPAELYRKVTAWLKAFGADHPNAEAARGLLAAVARQRPIATFEPSWFAVFTGPGRALSLSPDGLRRWDLERLAPLDEAPWKVSAWASVPDPRQRGLLTLGAGDQHRVGYYDLRTAEHRPRFLRLPFPLNQVRYSPDGGQVSLRGFREVRVLSFPEGEQLYAHLGPAEVKCALPDGLGRVAIVYWGTLGHPTKPPPVVDVREMKTDRLLFRHKLVGSGLYMALAQDRRTLAVATGLGRVYLFDMQDPRKKRCLVGAELSDPQRGLADPPALRGLATAVAFTPDGETVFAVSSTHDGLKGGDIRGWDVASGRQVFVQRRPHPLRLIDVSPDGRWLLVTGNGHPFELWLWRP